MAFDADGYPIETKTPVATQQVAQQVDSDGYPTQATQEKEVAQQVNADGYPIQPTSDSPSALDYAGGLGIEISGSLASNVVASAVAPFTGPLAPITYGAISFAGGFTSSLLAQNYEGQGEVSWGRAFANAGITALPWGSSIKAAKVAALEAGKSQTGKEVAKQIAKIETIRGTAIGATQSVVIAGVDRQELPSPEEFVAYTGGGAVFGRILGYGMGKYNSAYGKTIGATKGKTPEQIDLELSNNPKLAEDVSTLHNIQNPENPTSASRIVEQADNSVTSNLAKNILNKTIDGGVSFLKDVGSALKPSMGYGLGGKRVIKLGDDSQKAYEELGIKIGARINKALKENPELTDDVNLYMSTGELTPRLQNQALGGDLNSANLVKIEMQKMAMTHFSTHKFAGLEAKEQDKLNQQIAKSMVDDEGYFSRQYRMNLDKDYIPDQNTRKELVEEFRKSIAIENLKEVQDKGAKKLTSEVIKKQAQQKVRDIENNFIGNRKIVKTPGPVDGIFLKRENPSKLQRKFMGEITSPGERISGTIKAMSRTVFRNETDIQLAGILTKLNLAKINPLDQPLDSSKWEKLKLRGNLETDLWVPKEVQFTISKGYLKEIDEQSNDVVLKAFNDFYSTSVSLSKATKVILNLPSYFINAYGAVSSMLMQGIVPHRGLSQATKAALSEYGFIDKIVAGNTKEGREAFNEYLLTAAKYGLRVGNITSEDILNGLKQGTVGKAVQKVISPIAKAYQASDIAFRLNVWNHNQHTLSTLAPTMSKTDRQRIAALMTNDFYQNYDMTSPIIKTSSRIGLLPQFVTFTADFVRISYNQIKMASLMVFKPEVFAKHYGITDELNTTAARTEGLKRLASLGVVVAGTESMIRSYNNEEGITPEKYEALKFTVTPDFDSSKSLLVKVDDRDPTGNSLSYTNTSYLVPAGLIADVMNAVREDLGLSDEKNMSGKTQSTLMDIILDNFLGSGTFVGGNIYNSLQNRDQYNNTISDRPEGYEKAYELLSSFVSETFKPGSARELERYYKTLSQEKPDQELGELMQRWVGIRFNNLKIDLQAKRKVRNLYNNVRSLNTKYSNTVLYQQPNIQQREKDYQRASAIREDNLKIIIQHKKNLVTLGKSEDEIIKILRGAGLSSKDLLWALDNRIPPLKWDPTKSIKEKYEELISGVDPKDIPNKISSMANKEPFTANKFIAEFKNRLLTDALKITERDKLIKNLDPEDRAAYAIDKKKVNELLSKKVLNTESIYELQKQGGL